MLVRIENFLTKQEVTDAVSLLEKADWVDGAVTAGHLALHAKKNLQLPEDSPRHVSSEISFELDGSSRSIFLQQDYQTKYTLHVQLLSE